MEMVENHWVKSTKFAAT